ncbi:MAG: methyltransferase domain-containing protein [Bacteroidia bacterium]
MILYNQIGLTYNSTRSADQRILKTLHDLLEPKSGERYLDIGCGTGNYTKELSRMGLTMYGVDPSDEMLKKALASEVSVEWKQGTAEAIPYPDNYFAGGIATLTLHHWKDPRKAFQEIARVIKSGGTFVLFSTFPEQMKNYWLNHYFPVMMYDSTVQMADKDKILSLIEGSELRLESTHPFYIDNSLTDHFLFTGKHRPEIYFDETIRSGISSFAALSRKEEVEKGLLQLQSDLISGRFEEVKRQFKDDTGDYVFIRFKSKK